MPVVSNTSPISNLAVIGRLGCLRDQFREVLVPCEVLTELQRLRHEPGQAAISQALASGWLVPTVLADDAPKPHQIHHLDCGERSAIRLALASRASRLLIDEADGRAVALSLGLAVAGVVGILIEAKRRQQMNCLKDELDRLRKEARFFIDRRLESRALAAVGE